MATYSRRKLSESTDGRAIAVTATASAGTLLHTGPSSANDFDEVWLYLSNIEDTPHEVNIEYGGTSSSDRIRVFVPAAEGLLLVVPGLTLIGNATPLVVRAYADDNDSIFAHGYVNRGTG